MRFDVEYEGIVYSSRGIDGFWKTNLPGMNRLAPFCKGGSVVCVVHEEVFGLS